MSADLVRLDNLKPKSITISDAKENRNNKMSKSANVSYENKRFNLVMTDVRFPFGASAKKEEFRQGDKDQWSLQCELTEEQIRILKELDECVVDLCLQNDSITDQFLVKGKKPSRDVLESKYTSCLKYSKKDGKVNEQYPPTFRVNVPNDKGNGFTASFFRPSPQGSQLVEVDNIPGSEHNIAQHIPPNSRGSIVIGMSLWMTASGFGLSMRLNQIKTEQSKQLDRGVCLLDKLLQSGESTGYKTVEDPEHLSEAASERELETEEGRLEEEVEEQLEDVADSPEDEPTPPPKVTPVAAPAPAPAPAPAVAGKRAPARRVVS